MSNTRRGVTGWGSTALGGVGVRFSMIKPELNGSRRATSSCRGCSRLAWSHPLNDCTSFEFAIFVRLIAFCHTFHSMGSVTQNQMAECFYLEQGYEIY